MTELFTADSSPFVFEQKRNPNGAGRRKPKKAAFDDRPFVAWDGEGWTDHGSDRLCGVGVGRECLGNKCVHHYCLFGSSAGNSIRGDSLATLDCLQLMLATAYRNPTAIHIGYAFSYDVNMILKDLPVKKIQELKDTTVTNWRGYRIEHIPKKWFHVSGVYLGRKVSIRIQDVFSFFGGSFVNALKAWKVGTTDEVEEISAGKDSRNSFSLSELDSIITPYWEKELRLLVRLGDALRDILYSAGIKISSWFGPGNIATYLYKQHNTQDRMNQELSREIITAGQYAYAGGRFESFKAGYHDGPVYSADINSAYPYALASMPDLRSGEWVHYDGKDSADYISTVPTRFGLYKVEFVFRPEIVKLARRHGFPLPVFHRRKTGHVWYPEMSHGWYHAPEFQLLMDAYNENPGHYARFEILEAWIYHDDGSYPFAWVGDMFAQRLEWKRAGNPAQMALKLGLNSLYGKLAQRIGSKDGSIPQWHQLEWAGAVTATCRAMIYRAALSNWRNVIAVETDGIYATAPFVDLENGFGDQLGQWEAEEYSGMLFLQNGVYWARSLDGNWKPPKSRGIPQRHLDINEAIRCLASGDVLSATQQYFVGYGTALHRDSSGMAGWRTWRSGSKSFEFGGNGKRFHSPERCPECQLGMALDEGLHTLSLRLPELRVDSLKSAKHHLPWFEEITSLAAEIDAADRWEILDA